MLESLSTLKDSFPRNFCGKAGTENGVLFDCVMEGDDILLLSTDRESLEITEGLLIELFIAVMHIRLFECICDVMVVEALELLLAGLFS